MPEVYILNGNYLTYTCYLLLYHILWVMMITYYIHTVPT